MRSTMSAPRSIRVRVGSAQAARSCPSVITVPARAALAEGAGGRSGRGVPAGHEGRPQQPEHHNETDQAKHHRTLGDFPHGRSRRAPIRGRSPGVSVAAVGVLDGRGADGVDVLLGVVVGEDRRLPAIPLARSPPLAQRYRAAVAAASSRSSGSAAPSPSPSAAQVRHDSREELHGSDGVLPVGLGVEGP